MDEWLLGVADALFGSDVGPDDRPGRSWPRYLAIAVLLMVILVARRPDVITNPQFYGEDGFIFFRQNLLLGFGRATAGFYGGFPYLGHRLIALAGGWVPFSAAPRVYTTISIAITAFALGSFTLPSFRHLVRSDRLRVFWCICAASLPCEYGTPGLEDPAMLGTLANLGWWVGIWLSLLSLVRLPKHVWQVILLALGGALAILTTPLVLVNTPLVLLRAWRAVRRSDHREFGFVLALAAAMALCVAITGNLGANRTGAIHLSFFDNPPGYLRAFARLLADRVAAVVLAPGPLLLLQQAGATAAVTLVVFAMLGAAVLAARGRTLWAVLAVLYLVVASLLIVMLGRLVLMILPLDHLPARYTVPPAALLVLAIVIALDGLPHGLLRSLSLFGVAVLLGWSWRTRFPLERFQDRQWEDYAALLTQKRTAGSTAPLDIPMNPAYAPLRFDVRPLLPEARVPPSQVVGSLGSDDTFTQTFVSSCDGLDGIVVQLKLEGISSRGRLELTLVDTARGERVASVAIPRARLLRDAPQPFYFSPIPGSAGRQYAIVLHAVQNDPAAPVSVLGAAGDHYRDGHADFHGPKADVDASFAYSCRTAVDVDLMFAR